MSLATTLLAFLSSRVSSRLRDHKMCSASRRKRFNPSKVSLCDLKMCVSCHDPRHVSSHTSLVLFAVPSLVTSRVTILVTSLVTARLLSHPGHVSCHVFGDVLCHVRRNNSFPVSRRNCFYHISHHMPLDAPHVTTPSHLPSCHSWSFSCF